MPRRGRRPGPPRCTSPPNREAPSAVEALLAHGADPDVREPRWGQTPLMFAAGAARSAVVAPLLRWGADPAVAAKVVDISARNAFDQADSRRRRGRMMPEAFREPAPPKHDRPGRTAGRGAPGSPSLGTARPAGSHGPAPPVETAPVLPPPRPRRSDRFYLGFRPGPQAAAGATEADRQEEPEPLGYADLVGTHGGLTALLLAARATAMPTRRWRLIAGGADVNQVSAADGTEPPVDREHQRALRSGPAAPRSGGRPHPGERRRARLRSTGR